MLECTHWATLLADGGAEAEEHLHHLQVATLCRQMESTPLVLQRTHLKM